MHRTNRGNWAILGMFAGFPIGIIVGVATGDIANWMVYGAGIGAAVGSTARVLSWLSNLVRRR